MAKLNYDVPYDIVNEPRKSYGKIMLIIDTFIKSGKEIAEVQFQPGEYKNCHTLASALQLSLKEHKQDKAYGAF